jgi:hypothetical protein
LEGEGGNYIIVMNTYLTLAMYVSLTECLLYVYIFADIFTEEVGMARTLHTRQSITSYYIMGQVDYLPSGRSQSHLTLNFDTYSTVVHFL